MSRFTDHWDKHNTITVHPLLINQHLLYAQVYWNISQVKSFSLVLITPSQKIRINIERETPLGLKTVPIFMWR